MDQTELLREVVVSALNDGRHLKICGQGSKRHYLPEISAEMVNTVEHTGIVALEPEELVVTVRAGTPLKVLRQELARGRQMLGAEPPEFSGLGTVGGALGSGFSGPGRPWRGSLRDSVLGIEVINGKGELLKFGGQVMKNVAGYDVSRLNVGAFANLGLILQASLRLAPQPDHSRTLCYELDGGAALRFCRQVAQQPYPVTATFWHDDNLSIRLEGAESALDAAEARLGGQRDETNGLWSSIRDHRHVAFSAMAEGGAVRVICPPNAPAPEGLDWSFEWNGGLRWIWTNALSVNIAEYVHRVNGWAWQLGCEVPIESGQKQIMRRIKQAFDPGGVFRSPLNLLSNLDESDAD